ncbi:prepilin-type N-terminal cleavage/methylation domain-containing protein [Candidatus Peregrinibacteria bacterium]|nr:prepilin-type N-terminal cleavage/methylation domain-containing protein [Candidatus Peregrinibacteria bacterium]
MNGKKASNQGFTLVELIVVIAIFVILFSTAVMVIGDTLNRHNLKNEGNQIVQTLREARTNAVAGRFNSKWGVYLNTSTNPDSYILFKGNTYSSRDSDYDLIRVFPSAVSFSNISISGGSEIVFDVRGGGTDNIGSLRLVTSNDQFGISVNRLGLIDYNI